ncbi:hypothetical protein RHSIM_RhsimUnG0098100 [Rhododendron simsii]|uniref:Uncharacterized protein n=1 Tax=Rhododendron simsii TaxID=118357 RepID=A0A834L2L8_RHOSS|nr:hypothetical protein RHSIM_RhsimUnG0098100 [Rhododendron simsii]
MWNSWLHYGNARILDFVSGNELLQANGAVGEYIGVFNGVLPELRERIEDFLLEASGPIDSKVDDDDSTARVEDTAEAAFGVKMVEISNKEFVEDVSGSSDNGVKECLNPLHVTPDYSPPPAPEHCSSSSSARAGALLFLIAVHGRYHQGRVIWLLIGSENVEDDNSAASTEDLDALGLKMVDISNKEFVGDVSGSSDYGVLRCKIRKERKKEEFAQYEAMGFFRKSVRERGKTKRHKPKAIFLSAVAAMSLSISSNGIDNRNRIILDETQAVWVIDMITLGIGYDGDEGEVIIVEWLK